MQSEQHLVREIRADRMNLWRFYSPRTEVAPMPFLFEKATSENELYLELFITNGGGWPRRS